MEKMRKIASQRWKKKNKTRKLFWPKNKKSRSKRKTLKMRKKLPQLG